MSGGAKDAPGPLSGGEEAHAVANMNSALAPILRNPKSLEILRPPMLLDNPYPYLTGKGSY